jgi:PII-like signaling protein
MKGCLLRFYVHEKQRHRGMPLHEWLLEQARRRGLPGGSAFRAIAGFGRHGVLQEQHFFELAGESTVLVEFLASDEEAEALLAAARADGAPLFYARFAAEFGVLSRAPA